MGWTQVSMHETATTSQPNGTSSQPWGEHNAECLIVYPSEVGCGSVDVSRRSRTLCRSRTRRGS